MRGRDGCGRGGGVGVGEILSWCLILRGEEDNLVKEKQGRCKIIKANMQK